MNFEDRFEGKTIVHKNVPLYYKGCSLSKIIEFESIPLAALKASELKKECYLVKRLRNVLAIYGNEDPSY